MNVYRFFVKQLNTIAILYYILGYAEAFGTPTGIISTVYNLRVSETTQLITEDFKNPCGLGFTFFEVARWQRKSNHKIKFDRSNAVGDLVTFLYMLEPLCGRSWYVGADFAVARVSEVSDGRSFARIQTDDLLLTVGYGWLVHSYIRFTLSGMLGIPTHKDTSLDQIQFGTGHVGLGIQLDAAIKYRPKSKCSIRLAARVIGTIPRSSTFNSCHLNYNLGEIIDLFISHHAPFGKHNLEVGYNPTFVVASGISPSIQPLASELNLIRNSYYAAYEYNFEIRKIDTALEWGLSFGSDVIPKKTGQKLIVFGWMTWDVNF